ncbi:MAG: lipoprotein insertase outer membrane protein LolB [Wenzhouxiangellaceae bacterium]
MIRHRISWAAILALLAAGCTTLQPPVSDDELRLRQAWFESHPDWRVEGRLGLSDGKRGGSLGMIWEVDGSRQQLDLRTLSGGQQWRLRITPAGAELEGSDIDHRVGPDPDVLVAEAVGWPIPVRYMADWLRGLPAPRDASLRFDEHGRLAGLSWNGWEIDYRGWSALDADVALPTRIDAVRGEYRVRLVLRGWRFDKARDRSAATPDA